MTDEERQKLRGDLLTGICEMSWLLTKAHDALAQPDAEPHEEIVKIEPREFVTDVNILGRVREQSDAEPVAWRWRYKGPWPWTFIDDRFSVQRLASHNEIEVEPLYAAPPRPDAGCGADRGDRSSAWISRPSLVRT